MEKRIGWKIVPAIGGKFAVAALFKGGVVGNAIIVLKTEEEAQKFIDSGLADELDQRGRK